MLQFGLRLGDWPRQMVTTTPRPTPLVKRLIAAPTTALTRALTRDNAANLAPGFLETIAAPTAKLHLFPFRVACIATCLLRRRPEGEVQRALRHL